MAHESDEDALSTSFEPKTFKLYKKRWLILLVLSLLQCSNAMVSRHLLAPTEIVIILHVGLLFFVVTLVAI